MEPMSKLPYLLLGSANISIGEMKKLRMYWPYVILIVASHLLLRGFLDQHMIGPSCKKPFTDMGPISPIHPQVHSSSLCIVGTSNECVNKICVISAMALQGSFTWWMQGTQTGRDIKHRTGWWSTINRSGDMDHDLRVEKRYLIKLIRHLGLS